MQFLKGMAVDTVPEVQPSGTYRYLLNGILSDKYGAIVSEKGTDTHIETLSSGSLDVISTLWTLGDEVFLFCINSGVSKILKVDLIHKTIDTVIEDNTTDKNIVLKFNTKYKIQAAYTRNIYGEKVLYFTDGVNPPRTINVNTASTINKTYQLNLFPTIANYPVVKVNRILENGGRIKTGNYTFGLCYIAEDGSKTNYIGFDDFYNLAYTIGETKDEVQLVNNAISLRINNLDPAYNRLQIVVVLRSKEGEYEISLLPIMELSENQQSLNYTYTGLEEFETASIDEILINKAYYSTAKALTVQDSRLYLANLSKKQSSSLFQAIASGINAKCVIKEIPKSEYLKHKTATFKENEVYAFYISFVYSDGSESEAYLIQGREEYISNNETSLISEIDDEWFALKSKYPDLRKYHCFPQVDPETGFGYWKNEIDGYRHHRFPYFSNAIIPTGLEDNVVDIIDPIDPPDPEPDPTNPPPPPPSTTKPFDLSNINPTVIWSINDNGQPIITITLTKPEVQNTEGGAFVTFTESVNYKLSFLSAEENQDVPLPIFFSSDAQEVSHSQVVYGELNYSEIMPNISGYSLQYSAFGITKVSTPPDVDPPVIPPTVETITRGQWDDINTFKVFGVKFQNINIPQSLKDEVIGYKFYYANRNSSNSIILDEALVIPMVSRSTFMDNSTEGASFTSGNISKDVENARFIRNAFSTHPQTLLHGGESFIGIDYIRSVTTKLGFYTIPKIRTVAEKTKIPSNVGLVTLPFEIAKGLNKVNNNREEEKILLVLDDDNSPITETTTIETFNYELRSVRKDLYYPYTAQQLISFSGFISSTERSTDEIYNGDSYYSKSNTQVVDATRILEVGSNPPTQKSNPNTGALLFNITVSTYDKIPYLNRVDLDTIKLQFNILEDIELYYKRYNKIFLKRADLKPAFPKYKPLDSNLHKDRKLKNRIIRSEKFENTDLGYRVFKENDYMDIRSDRGNILKLQPIENNLLIHSQRGFFLTKGAEKALIDGSSGISSVYLGSGNIFAAPATERFVSDIGLGGIESVGHAINTPSGYVFLDYFAKSIYLIGENIIPLSSRGMHYFFKENIPFKLESLGKFKYNSDLHYPYFDFILGFDPAHNRLMVTKKELVPVEGKTFVQDIDGEALMRDIDQDVKVPYSDTSYFRSESWTISYSFEFNVWASFHSYTPDIYIPSLINLISIKNKRIYLHNIKEDLRYYNTPANFEISIIDNANPNIEKQITSLILNTKVSSPESGDLPETFNYAHIKNDTQQSEVLNLDPDLPNIRRIRGIWNYNNIRAILNTNDKYPQWFGKKKLKGKYHIIELRYDYKSNRRIYLFSCGLQSFIPHR
jgi:hypothetical protein